MDKEIKKKVAEDWVKAFPQLTLYEKNKLYKVVGPVIIGIEMIKLPRTEEYRPHFVMYSLWNKDIKANFYFPIVLKEYYNKNGTQYSIPYEKHIAFFSDVLESIKKQNILPFDGDVHFRKMISAINEYSKTPPLSAAPNSYLQAVLQEAILKITLFINKDEAQIILKLINKKSWDANHFEACGMEISKWLHNLEQTISDRDEFLKQIEINQQDKKIAKLKRSELIA